MTAKVRATLKGPSALDVAAKVLSAAMHLRDYPRAETLAAVRLLMQSNPAIVAWLREVALALGLRQE